MKSIVDNEKLTSLANAIRTKTNTTDSLTIDQMTSAIENISVGGGEGQEDQMKIYMSRFKTVDVFKGYIGESVDDLLKFDYTENFITINQMFYNASNLKSVPLFNTSNVINMREMFRGCRALKTVPQFDTSKVTTIYGMFNDCISLKTLPLLDTGALNTGSSINSVFVNCLNLSDQSLDNILQMCINATSLPSSVPKTLFNLGITSTTAYPASRIQALPHYQDFIDAGWTMGY